KFLQGRDERLAVAALPSHVGQGQQPLPHALRVYDLIWLWPGRGRAHLDLALSSNSAIKSSSRTPPVASISRTCLRNSSSSKVCRAHARMSGGILSRGKGSDGLDGSGFIGCSFENQVNTAPMIPRGKVCRKAYGLVGRTTIQLEYSRRPPLSRALFR